MMVSASNHSAEFVQAKEPEIPADSMLRIKDRAAIVKLDRKSYQTNERRTSDQAEQRTQEIEDAGDSACPIGSTLFSSELRTLRH